jgi:hypothetical protein
MPTSPNEAHEVSMIVTLKKDPETGEIYLPIPDALMDRLGWRIGDEVKIEMVRDRPRWIVVERVRDAGKLRDQTPPADKKWFDR